MKPIETLRRLVSGFLLHPEELQIDVAPGDGSGTLEITLRAPRGDTCRLIGGGGKHFRALEFIVGRMGVKYMQPARLLPIPRSDFGPLDKNPKFEPKADWPKEEIIELLREVCLACLNHELLQITAADNGEYSTKLTVKVSTDEPLRIVEEFATALRELFDDIGKAKGRILYIDMLPVLHPDGELAADAPKWDAAKGDWANAGLKDFVPKGPKKLTKPKI